MKPFNVTKKIVEEREKEIGVSPEGAEENECGMRHWSELVGKRNFSEASTHETTEIRRKNGES